MNNKTPAVVIIMVSVLFMSLLFFPILSTIIGLSSIGWNNFISACVFISIWIAVLITAAKMKSRALLYMYHCYWVTVTISCIFSYIAMALGDAPVVFYAIALILMTFFLMPISGVLYPLTRIAPNRIFDIIEALLDTSTYSLILLILALGMFLLGFLVKIKFFKKELSND